jgi:tryptophan 2,3-dioxygenase
MLRYQSMFAHLIDPTGVMASPYPRPMAVCFDEDRIDDVKETGGQPKVDFYGNSNPYDDYQSLDLLLSLPYPRSQGYDEMCFCVTEQVKGLLFRGIPFKLHSAREQIKQGNVTNAIETLGRSRAFCEYFMRSWDVLSTISPEGFNQFRNHLGAFKICCMCGPRCKRR